MKSYNEDKKKAATDGNDNNNNNKDNLISTLQCRDVNTLSENVKVGLMVDTMMTVMIAKNYIHHLMYISFLNIGTR